MSHLKRSLDRLRAAARSPLFAYGSILLLQMKVLWGMWRFKDMEAGDTAEYFVHAWSWFECGQNQFGWSPLYTAYYGTVMQFTTHAYAVTVLHRVLVALAATALVLAVMRRMLPAALAWLVAAWWAVLPINFDTLYTVHLFAALPPLLAVLAATRGPSPWSRGVALAVLLAGTVLVRNEMIVGAGFWAVVCLVWEWRAWKRASGTVEGRRAVATGDAPQPVARRFAAARTAVAYAVPLLAACLLVGFFYERSLTKQPELKAGVEAKHALSMAQSYAFGYRQRHPEWRANPWTDYGPLMEREFGEAMPPMSHMMRRNPAALLGHLRWNLRLIPAGLQVMLFNITSAKVTPDYLPVRRKAARALLLSGAAGMLVICGAVVAWRRRRFWWRAWFAGRAQGWLAMLCVAAAGPPVMLTNRPRPAYLFPLTVTLMAAVATGAFILYRTAVATRARRPVNAALPAALPLVMAAVILLAPNPYSTRHRRSADASEIAAAPARSARPLLDSYERLRPHQNVMARDDAVWLADSYAYELRNLLKHGRGRTYTFDLLASMRPGERLLAFLERKGVNLVYLDAESAARVEGRAAGTIDGFLRAAPSAGWRAAGAGGTRAGRWVLLWKPPARVDRPAVPAGDFTSLNPLRPVAAH